jgi:hypothetical protein
VEAAGSPLGLLMRDLGEPLRERIQKVVDDEYRKYPAIVDLVNAVMTDGVDVEHIITFLDQSSSGLHKQFAQDLRSAFEAVLTQRLEEVEKDTGGPPVTLYEAVLDLHAVKGFTEELKGILTLNYDQYIEAAIERSGSQTSLGLAFDQDQFVGGHRLLKLHGSFGWDQSWPVARRPTPSQIGPLWIPPGIQKDKDQYPFNLLWGQARELLDCDVLRIVGCHLGPNDWDLISLLFTTRHTNARTARAYRIEIINSPKNAEDLRSRHPYLDPTSILDQEPVGIRLISELIGGSPRRYQDLTPDEKAKLEGTTANLNWFRLWLVHMAEDIYENLGAIDSPRGVLRRLMEER